LQLLVGGGWVGGRSVFKEGTGIEVWKIAWEIGRNSGDDREALSELKAGRLAAARFGRILET